MRTEPEHNLILGLALAMAAGELLLEQSPYLATVVDHDEVVACALRTPPYKLSISRADAEAARALAHDVFALEPALPAVMGSEPAAGAFASTWAGLSGRRARVGMRQRLYVIETIAQPVPAVGGGLRRAEEADLDHLVPWIAAFQRDTRQLVELDAAAVARRNLRHRRLFVWDDGEPVAMAGFGGKTPNGARVSLVYTPPEARRRGYAAAAVGALTRLLLDEGNRYCCLYTDLANPTSNGVYQRLGYRPLLDVNDHELAGA